MAQITASLVKELRARTGAGMMDCKTALTETDSDIERAIDWLREKGLATAAKRAGRAAAEGLVAVATDGGAGALVEVNAETDFVARNAEFQDFVREVAGIARAEGGDLDRIKRAACGAENHTVADRLTALIGRIGENLVLRRSAALHASPGVVASYVHNAVAPDLGRIGVLVAIESSADRDRLSELGRKLAMHVCAARPEAVTREGVEAVALDRERRVLAEQAKASGKPPEIIEKMVEGRLNKYYREVALVEQTYVIDGESTVGAVIEAAAKELGAAITVTGFVCFALGEGVETAQSDFAAEVAAQLGEGPAR